MNARNIKTVIKKINLDLEMRRLFEGIQAIAPSAWLQQTLAMTEFLPPTNEKAKSERLISPILIEVAHYYQKKVSFFSGKNIEIDSKLDLAGPCDFFFSLQSPKPYFEAPIVSLAEAKDEDMDWGIAQCAAQIYGAKLFNEREGKNLPFLYGCATDGIEWHFLRFENDVFELDTKIYTDLNLVLGIWSRIIGLYVNP
ncbi:MAG: hypothetical protein ACPGVB_05155 [Chitinophagales bacterium]